ncbi:MAG: hypothetical protein IPK53_11215 [bacterium]|nr:hypothetical protein [bacterium]
MEGALYNGTRKALTCGCSAFYGSSSSCKRAFGMVDVQRYKHGLAEQIQAIGASKNTVLLGMTGRYTEAFCFGSLDLGLVRTPRKRMVTLKPPVRDYLLKNRALHPWFKESAKLQVISKWHISIWIVAWVLLLHLPNSSSARTSTHVVFALGCPKQRDYRPSFVGFVGLSPSVPRCGL